MAGERTEAATPRRLQTLRAEGRVVRSADLNTAIGLLAAFVLLQQFGGESMRLMRGLLERQLVDLARGDLTLTATAELGRNTGIFFLGVMAPILFFLPIVGIVAGLGQVGFLLSGQAVSPSFSRINPFEGMKRLVSTRSLVELAKTLVKAGLLALLLTNAYMQSVPTLAALASTDLALAGPQLASLALRLGFISGAGLLVLAGIDYLYQRWDFQRSARMTREELREELRQTEGAPEVRGRIRQLQRRMARGRMMLAVPMADVVITNPTHFAVALVYRTGEMGAPQVVAKGAGLVAARIKAIAAEHGVPVTENKSLAQALFKYVEIGAEIPADLFQAVAEVLAYIYALRGKGRSGTAPSGETSMAPELSADQGRATVMEDGDGRG
jgi:flagellar biosynthesis protein FlhB